MKPDEIKKALECCKSPVGSGACNSCPFDYQRKKRLAPTEGSCTVLMFDCVLVYINQLEAEKRNLEYTLLGVMHFVDKWLDENELRQDEVNRADTMRHKTLQIIEEQQAEIEKMKTAKSDT